MNPSDYVFVAIFIQSTSGGILVHAFDGIDDLVHGHPVMAHTSRIHEDLVFLDVPSGDCYLGDTPGREESRPDRPVRQCPEILHRGGICSKAYYHQFTED